MAKYQVRTDKGYLDATVLAVDEIGKQVKVMADEIGIAWVPKSSVSKK